MKISFNKRGSVVAAGVALALLLILIWLATTDNVAIWPIRNTLQYRALTWWWNHVGQPPPGKPGILQGRVSNTGGQPIEGAWVLVSRRDGTTYSARTGATGHYRLQGVPAGSYRPVAGAPGYDDVEGGGLWGPVKIKAGAASVVNIVLPDRPTRPVTPGRNLSLSQAMLLTCTTPLETSATRRQVTFDNNGQPNQPAFYYTPVIVTRPLPLLLTVYPGPADRWDCASIPLAAAGYAVLAAGPAYSFELERDIDELERLLAFARSGMLPDSDGANIAVLGGSYSALHVLRLLQRDPDIRAAVLLGPPTDLFDMRRRLENGTFIPPFGLDQALIALGFPSEEPLRYWRYSGAYHVQPHFPPIALLHSRSDDVVPYQQSELLAANLAEMGLPHEVHFFERGSHYLLAEKGDADALKMYRITLDFLAKYLKTVEPGF